MTKVDLITPKFFAMNCKFIEPTLTYEHYLVEVINGSLNYFVHKRTVFEQFQLQSNQSHGEDDVFSSMYSMDFKLLIDQDFMNAMAKNRPDIDYSYKDKGFIFINEKKNKVPVPNKNIFAELARLKKDELSSQGLSQTTENLLANLRKDKNLFFYYPYLFSSDKSLPGEAFVEFLNGVLSVIMNYRQEVRPDRDTFFCFKANEWFHIYEWTTKGFVFRDSVFELLCSNYLDVKPYSLY